MAAVINACPVDFILYVSHHTRLAHGINDENQNMEMCVCTINTDYILLAPSLSPSSQQNIMCHIKLANIIMTII